MFLDLLFLDRLGNGPGLRCLALLEPTDGLVLLPCSFSRDVLRAVSLVSASLSLSLIGNGSISLLSESSDELGTVSEYAVLPLRESKFEPGTGGGWDIVMTEETDDGRPVSDQLRRSSAGDDCTIKGQTHLPLSAASKNGEENTRISL
jgi:hypothetical protein